MEADLRNSLWGGSWRRSRTQMQRISALGCAPRTSAPRPPAYPSSSAPALRPPPRFSLTAPAFPRARAVFQASQSKPAPTTSRILWLKNQQQLSDRFQPGTPNRV